MINKKSASYPTSESGVSSASKVAEMWGNHFGSLLNSIANDSCNNVVQTSVNSIQYYNTTDFYCDVFIIGISINKLPCNSAAGFNGVIKAVMSLVKAVMSLVKAVMSLYEGAETKIRVGSGLLEEFFVKVGVHQGSVLSPLLFSMVYYDYYCE